MITFIARKNGLVLWSYGNYQYQIEGNGIQQNFEADYDDALARLQAFAA